MDMKTAECMTILISNVVKTVVGIIIHWESAKFTEAPKGPTVIIQSQHHGDFFCWC